MKAQQDEHPDDPLWRGVAEPTDVACHLYRYDLGATFDRQRLGHTLSTRRLGEETMAKLIQCECGFVARGDNDEQVIGAIRGHLATDHPALLDTVSQEELLSWIRVE